MGECLRLLIGREFFQVSNQKRRSESKAEWLVNKSLYSEDDSVDLTQMPMLPYALDAIHRRKKDVSLLKEFLPKIVNYYKVRQRSMAE